MNKKFYSQKSEVKKFLSSIKNIINSPNFNIDRNFIWQERLDDLEPGIYSNLAALSLLNYNDGDVIKEIASLKVEDYYETIIDTISDYVYLYVFKKIIKGYLIYIKLAVKNNRLIVCFSFHLSY